MMKRARAAMEPAAEPNVIPFIDVLLVLLIIFMVTAPRPTTDLRVDLPANGVVQPALGQATIVDISADLSLFVDGEQVTFASLPDTATAHALVNNPEMDASNVHTFARVLVRADQDAAYGNVVNIVDALQQARFDKVGIFGEEADAG